MEQVGWKRCGRGTICIEDALVGRCVKEAAFLRSESVHEELNVFWRECCVLRETTNEETRMILGVKSDPVWSHGVDGEAEEAEIICRRHVNGGLGVVCGVMGSRCGG